MTKSLVDRTGYSVCKISTADQGKPVSNIAAPPCQLHPKNWCIIPN